MSDERDLRARVRDAIANGVPGELLPGLEATVDRVLDEVDPELATRWRVHALLDEAGRPRRGLDLELVVDTHATTVVDAIERAAAANGVELERIAEPPA